MTVEHHNNWQSATALPTSHDALEAYLAREKAFPGIGPKRAQALSKAFGEDLIDALGRIDEGVIEIVGDAAAIAAAAAVETRKPEIEFLKWLRSIRAKIKPHKAIRMARAWGPQGLSAVKENPYLLLALADFKTVDKIGRSAGVAEHDLRRDVAALEAALMGEGYPRQNRARIDGGFPGQGSTRLALKNAQEAAERLLRRPLAKIAVQEAVASGAAIRLGTDLQPPGASYMEAECALIFARLAPQEPRTGITPVKRLDELVNAYENAQPFPLTEAQRDAVRMAHRHRLLVIAGYAGSGKTTLLRGVCQTLEKTGRKPLIVTLSGRAAKRASEATGRRAITVARFLIELEKTNVPLGPETALIADEASMLGLVEIWRIVRRLGDASLLLCGDPAQLPPVSSGIVFHTLVSDQDIRKVVLDRVHRQSSVSGIPAIAKGVRSGWIARLKSFAGDVSGVTFESCSRKSVATKTQLIRRQLRSAGSDRDDIQIIAPTNQEVDAINRFFHAEHLMYKPVAWPVQKHLAEGEPVIWEGKNDMKRGITKGALGRIERIMTDVVLVSLDGIEHYLNLEDGLNLKLAYCISVHKAQGSQWRKVIVPVFQSEIVDRSLIYTALTRAQDQIIFVGDWATITAVVSGCPSAERRFCGFPDWLKLARTQIRN